MAKLKSISVLGSQVEWLHTKLTPTLLPQELLELLVRLHREFGERREELLAARAQLQDSFDDGALPEYLPKDSEMVAGDWKVAELPQDLLTRRVEITGPVNNAKMVINMLSRNADGARADCAMVDFEDSMKPSWKNVLFGIQNVIDAAKGELSYTQPASGDKPEKQYAVDPDDMAVLMVRCRGLHLAESNFRIDGKPISAGLFDLTSCFFHTAGLLVERNKTPKYYVPKVEHHLEARWWSDLFVSLEDHLNFPRSTLRATFLIETLTAAYQIEEILYEIRDHVAGLNVGRWDKIFSDIKVLRAHADRISPDRGQIDMSCEWMKNYALRLIEICHSRGAFAMGGMAAFTPGRDEETRKAQTDKVISDKRSEYELGHDGCWVSHPYFIGPALEQFPTENQREVTGVLPDKYPDLLPQPIGTRTEGGLRKNIRVGIAYIQGWRQNLGCIAWDDLMEDLATLEISRAQVWQWVRHGADLEDGCTIDRPLVSQLFDEEFEKIRAELGEEVIESGKWEAAYEEAKELFTEKQFREFLSLASEVKL